MAVEFAYIQSRSTEIVDLASDPIDSQSALVFLSIVENNLVFNRQKSQ